MPHVHYPETPIDNRDLHPTLRGMARVDRMGLLLACLILAGATGCQSAAPASPSPSPSLAPTATVRPTPRPTPSPTRKPAPTFIPLIETPSPDELAIIRHAQVQVEVLNDHIAAINAALEAESPKKLRAAAKSLGTWAASERAWLDAHPAPRCLSVPYGYYEDVVEAFEIISRRYLSILDPDTDPVFRDLLEKSIEMNWNVANGALQLLQFGWGSASAGC